jgi:hypothetical protein
MTVHELFLTLTRRSGQGPNRYRNEIRRGALAVPYPQLNAVDERLFDFQLTWTYLGSTTYPFPHLKHVTLECQHRLRSAVVKLTALCTPSVTPSQSLNVSSTSSSIGSNSDEPRICNGHWKLTGNCIDCSSWPYRRLCTSSRMTPQ